MKLALIVCLAGALAGCRKADDRTAAAVGSPIDGVEVLTAGASGSQRVLRYHLAKGVKTPLELAMDVEMIAGGRGGKLPTLVMTMEIGADDVLPDGTAKLRMTVIDAQVRDRAGSAVPAGPMRALTAAMIGAVFTASLSPDGKLADAKFDAPKTLPAAVTAQLTQLTQSIEQLAMRLPGEAVGVGAKWSSRRTVTQNGLAMVTVTTVELTAIEGERVTFTTSSTLSAPDQNVQQDGVSITIKDVGGGGAGSVAIDLSRMAMTGTLNAEFRGLMTAQGQSAPIKMAMVLTLR